MLMHIPPCRFDRSSKVGHENKTGERRVSVQRTRIKGNGSMAIENFVNVDGAQVAYRVQGKGLAVVLVNGAGLRMCNGGLSWRPSSQDSG